MIKDKKILVIIPARGGSKGIPHKNIKELNGKPLIAYTIQCAIESKYIDRVIVSTEDINISNVAENFGADVPFLRPEVLAEDDTPSIDVILHCINTLEANNEYYDYICLLQCTSPFRTVDNIDEAIYKLIEKNGSSLVSVCESEVNPYWMKKINDEKLIDFIKEIDASRRQDLPKIYRLNGAIYISKVNELKQLKSWYGKNTIPYIMNRKSSIDIDEPIDFKFAEFLMGDD